MMSQGLCDRFGFDDGKIAERIGVLGLTGPDVHTYAAQLQSHVIQPNIDAIIDDFYELLGGHPEFLEIVRERGQINRLKMTQRKYLLGLGQNFSTRRYFEERLRVGAVHQQVGVSLGLYQCFYSVLQSLLIARVSAEIKVNPEAFERLSQFIIKITSLDMSLAIETYHSAEVSILEESMNHIRDEGELLRQTLRIDSLTQVLSRACVIQELKDRLAASQADSRPLTVVMADLDHFKRMNDSFGHLAGDRILKEVASRMTSGARSSDIIGRYGGEEFVLIFDNTTLDVARALAERIRELVMAEAIDEQLDDLRITVSLGVAQALAGDDADSLTSRADQAMYAAKRAGRNTVRTELEIDQAQNLASSNT